MRRENWIKTLVAAGAFVAASIAAQAFESTKYNADTFKAAQANGAAVLVHVTAPWCPTCTAQHAVLQDLSSKPEYAKVMVVDVDFDTQKGVWKSLNATAQSTLIAFKGKDETGRLVGATASSDIEKLVQSTLK